MNEGWLELESDPGLFTLLVEEFGVKGVQVEEIYDLQKPIEGPVFGFIFLFKWIEERRARRKMSPADEAYVSDVEVVNNMFFAQQIVPNSCATHALLSVLLNCSDINLGQTLTGLKTFTNSFTPESKGYAIGNVAQIAKVHNSHAHPEPRRVKEKQSMGLITTSRNHEAFHFVSYVPINGRLFELDGLKPYPIDHGPWGDHEEWTEKFRRVIAERLENEGGSSDIRFNLMAVVADRRMAYEHRLSTLKNNKHIILDALEQLMHVNRPRASHHHSKSQQAAATAIATATQEQDQKVKEQEQSQNQSVKNINALSSCSPIPAVKQDVKPAAELPSVPPQVDEVKPSIKSEKEGLPEKDDTEEMEVDGDAAAQKEEQTMKKKRKTAKVKIKTFPMPPQPYRLPGHLDSHNYAKSPLESDEGDSSSELFTEDSDMEETSDGDEKSTTTTSSGDSSTASSSSDGAETDSESSTEDNKTEEESDAVDESVAVPTAATAAANILPDKQQCAEQGQLSKDTLPTEAETEDKKVLLQQQPDVDLPLPPKTEGGILKKQSTALDCTEKSDSPALRVTFSDAHQEKEVEGGEDTDDSGDKDVEILDSTIPADITKPLTIQTVFENGGPPSPASSNYSTDTASDAGSAFNSPIRSVVHSRSGSPNSAKQLKFKEWKTNVISEARAKLEATILEMDQKDSAAKKAAAAPVGVVPREGAHMGTRSKVARAAAIGGSPHQTRQSAAKRLAEQATAAGKRHAAWNSGDTKSKHASAADEMVGASALWEIPDDTWTPPRPSFLVSQNGKQPFAPRDLLELLKSVESEIEIYEQKLLDETEKRNKYKIDDCRRTHNYDPFICTFLTMLAEQNKLSALVEKHTVIKRRQGMSLGHLQKSRKRDRRRARSRPKKTKLK